MLLSDEGVHFNGIIHWVAKRSSTDMCLLLTYDLRAWEVGEVYLPMGKDFYTTIGVINGKICAIVPLGIVMSVLLMKFGWWWITSWRTGFRQSSGGFEGISKLSLLGEIGDSSGDLILGASPGCELFRYDVAANTVKSLLSNACDSRLYFPSLLPP